MTLIKPSHRPLLLATVLAALFDGAAAQVGASTTAPPAPAVPQAAGSDIQIEVHPNRTVFPVPAKVDERTLPVSGQADQVSGQSERETTLSGTAVLERGTTRVEAETILYKQVIDEVTLKGSAQRRARIIRKSPDGTDVIVTPEAVTKLDDSTGYAVSPEFYYGKVGGRGRADRLESLVNGVTQLFTAQYSTCRPGDDSWLLKADRIDLDQNEGAGEARNAVLYFKDVPILASPWIGFALGNQRRSGLLAPSLGITSSTGIDVTLPYYFNLATNYDLTAEPRMMSKRGLQLGAQFRYLQDSYHGEFRGDWMPNDRVFGGPRSLINANHAWETSPWSAGWNVQHVSDSRYFVDLSGSTSPIATIFLQREAWAGFKQENWNVSARISAFQTLQDPLSPVLPLYDRLPQINWDYQRTLDNGVQLTGTAQLTRFSHPTEVQGWRAFSQLGIGLPIQAPGYFIKPSLALNTSRYWALDQLQSGANLYGGPRSASRNVPIFAVDAGLFYERDEGWFFPKLQQTLEPRLFYLRVPFRDQSHLPVFDTALKDFGFAQVFTDNVYAGNDRIADANHVTLALTSRYVEPGTGQERLRLSIGKRFYFSPQRVDLPGNPVPVGSSSDLLLAASGQVTPSWSLDAALQLKSENNKTVRSNIGVTYSPAERNVLNLTYLFTRGTIEQLDGSTQWQVAPRWYLVARMNYSLQEKRVSESVVGVEYDADCWVLSTVVSRYATATKNTTTSLFIQLELSGLARIGNSPLNLLKRNIPGYRKLESTDSWTINPN